MENYKYLSKIDKPEDLHKFSIQEMAFLAEDIRSFIIENVLITGGHLSSNLGIIELTIALHYCFDFTKDSIIFDVSHQCYTHKILTGRKDSFSTIRHLNGISGFTNIHESIYDSFTCGHAGTSVSTALGLCIGNLFQDNKSKAIAVVGDASIVAGMSFEAMNHAGHLGKNVIVVLNDNNMSIDKTIGSISSYLNKLRNTQFYSDVKKDIYNFAHKMPVFGEVLKSSAIQLKELIKSFVLPGQFFNHLGFDYHGPINGHDISELITSFKNIKDRQKPLLVHVITEKGFGYSEAEANPTAYHGISPSSKHYSLNKDVNEPILNGKSFTNSFSDSMIKIGLKDEKVVAITAAMPDGTGLLKFSKLFSDRFYDVGICEQHAVGFAAGLAKSGLKPVVAIYSTFIQRAFDQIFQEVCLNELPIIFALDRAGISEHDGATHNGVFDISFLRALPNIILMAPKDPIELEQMLNASIDFNQPVAIRYPGKDSYILKPISNLKPIEIGKAEVLKEGKDVVLFGYGYGVYLASKASELLETMGIKAGVVNARFAKPFDKSLLEQYINNNIPIVTIEDHSIAGGFGSAVLECANSLSGNNSQLLIIGVEDNFIEHGSRKELFKKLSLDHESIAEKVYSFLSKNNNKPLYSLNAC